MKTNDKLTRHRAKLKQAGVVRFSIQLGDEAVSTLRRLCQQHGKTQRQVLELGISAADALLTGRLKVSAVPAKPKPAISVNAEPQPADADAKIKTAAFVVEP